MVSKTEFAVVDTETTGLFPGGHDKIIEIAIIRVDAKGNILDEYETLVNPLRDIGPTNLHGIAAGDVKNAPVFKEIAGDIIQRLTGAVFVAHNVTFDYRFIKLEMEKCGWAIPDMPRLCTMKLAKMAEPCLYSRKLGKVCEQFGIKLESSHAAYDDAQAAMQIMVKCINMIGTDTPNIPLSAIGVNEEQKGRLRWPSLPISGKSYKREKAAVDKENNQSNISRLVQNLTSAADCNPELDEYFAILDRVLEDRRILPEEVDELFDYAEMIGISSQHVNKVHKDYLRDLIYVYLEDNIISESERNDLEEARKLLSITKDDFNDLFENVIKMHEQGVSEKAKAIKQPDLGGKTVCFSGSLKCRINGEIAKKSYAQKIATDKGMIVKKGVIKALDYLVVADPDSMSGKAKKARKYGTRIIAEPVFWRMVGIQME